MSANAPAKQFAVGVQRQRGVALPIILVTFDSGLPEPKAQDMHSKLGLHAELRCEARHSWTVTCLTNWQILDKENPASSRQRGLGVRQDCGVATLPADP
jgi:hypothetical protein